MIGLHDDGSTFFDMQRRVASYDAAIAAIVNRMVQEQRRRILKVHNSTTTWEHQEGSFVTPDGLGYLRMAYDFLEGIVLANVLGWLNGVATPASTGAAATASSRSAPSTRSAAIGFTPNAPTKRIVFSQARPKAAPDYKVLTSALFAVLSQRDFISKVPCNDTAICNNSSNSNVSSVRSPNIT